MPHYPGIEKKHGRFYACIQYYKERIAMKLKCIGGYYDGRYMDVDENSPIARFVVQEKLPLSVPTNNSVKKAENTIIKYRIEKLNIQNNKIQLLIYDEWSIDMALRALIDRYR